MEKPELKISPKSKSINAASAKALRLFHDASKRVPAYKQFLKKHGINPASIKTLNDFNHVPYVDKLNYISKFALNELCWDGDLGKAQYVVTSSGSTGVPYYWPRGNEQDSISSSLYHRIVTETFEIGRESTLLVNSYGQGTWIAGTEFYNAARAIAEKLGNVAVINPGIEVKQAIAQISLLSKFYKKIVIAGYPPFIKDLISQGLKDNFEWHDKDLYLITAGEAITVEWREKVCRIIGKPNEHYRIINVYGMADAGVVAAETRATIYLREKLQKSEKNWPGFKLFGGLRTTGLLEYDPNTRFFQTNNDSQLLLTTRAGLPLIRYNTKDQGGLVSESEVSTFFKDVDIPKPSRPIVYLFGRKDLAALFYSVNIYPESIRTVLDGPAAPKEITGRFVISTKFKRNMDQILHIDVELNQGQDPTKQLKETLQLSVINSLRALNTEYNELSDKLGSRARPKIELKEFGSIGYKPGKKHKWVK